MQPSASKDTELLRQIGELAHAQLGGEGTPEQDRDGLQRLHERLARGHGIVGWWRRGAIAFGAVGLAAAAATAVVMVREPALTYQVSGSTPADDGMIQPAAANATVQFSDGTKVTLSPQTRGRVAKVGRRGARVVVDEGRAHLQVVKRPRAEWSVEAGPFEVLVTGTAFDVRWTKREQRLELRLTTGSVTVKGPFTGGKVDMVAGQRLVAMAGDRAVRVEPLEAPKPVVVSLPAAAPAPAPVIEEHPAERPTTRERPAIRPAAPPPPSWEQRVGAGEYRAVLRDVERVGLTKTLATASSADLAALADAARYAKRNDIARRSLLAQRKRFPTSARAEDAAFLLGRLAEDAEGDTAAAMRWYDTYLKEADHGPYSEEALGRKMVVAQKTIGRSQACSMAATYLERYPKGPYARIARAMCPAPR